MNFGQYVDDLAKRGIIDGNIAALLVAKHRAEVSNPLKPVRDVLQPVLDDMWSGRHDGDQSSYADKIDDALTELENHGRADK